MSQTLFENIGLTVCFVLLGWSAAYAQDPNFTGNVSVTYDEAIAQYSALAQKSAFAELREVGMTDVGRPLHVFMIEKPIDSPVQRPILFINNGIHPGEPCGIDASLQLAERLLTEGHELQRFLDSVVVAILPVYNIDGALRRGCCVRANQDGPEEYGFRGNARNLDLNRDFIKAESRNARSFHTLFHHIRPHVLIDTHTSNGADYSYVMTMINAQPDKAGGAIGMYIRQQMTPALYASMANEGFPMTPYVYSLGKTPESGLRDFLETPRFSTGYASLFNTIGYTSETHMLKPFAQRVESTYRFLVSTLAYMYAHASEIVALKEASDRQVAEQELFALNWELDTTRWELIAFDGYTAEYPVSAVTGEPRLRYNRDKPFSKPIRHYTHFEVTKSAQAPEAYIVPFAWEGVISRLVANGVEVEVIEQDMVMEVEAYYIDDFSSASLPYEGRHMKTVKSLRKEVESVQLFKGDCIVRVNQTSNRYIVETLEPEGVDSFFRWGFFDSVLQQKEWYSDYVFEDTAARLLEESPELREAFEAAKANDETLAASPREQLYWIYLRSPHYEGSVNRYPVFRIPRKP